MTTIPTTLAPALLLTLAAFSTTSTASAHCRLDTPNGGEVLRHGSTYTVTWTELVPHNVQNWDLYYSTQGASGPWIPLALDLPPASRSYDWKVDVGSQGAPMQVRVRVVQDMLSMFYDDVSDSDFTVLPSLTTTTQTITSAGGSQFIDIDAGPAHGGELYAVVGSITGTSPGQNILGAHIPLNLDAYFVTTVSAPNRGALLNTFGTLDPSGRARAEFVLPPFLSLSLLGIRLHHAAVLASSSGVITLVTNPAPLDFGV